jgi:hypothetical protein
MAKLKTKAELEESIASLEDDIACAEHDEEMDGGSPIDVDALQCQLSDLRQELAERFLMSQS